MNTSIELPDSVSRVMNPVISAVAAEGFIPAEYHESASFGDFAVTFKSKDREFLIARDRGQFIVHGAEKAALESAGLWQAFSGVQKLTPILVQWLRSNVQA